MIGDQNNGSEHPIDFDLFSDLGDVRGLEARVHRLWSRQQDDEQQKHFRQNSYWYVGKKHTHKCRFNEHRGYMFMILNLKSTNKCTKTKQNTQKGENGKTHTKTQKPSNSASHLEFFQSKRFNVFYFFSFNFVEISLL